MASKCKVELVWLCPPRYLKAHLIASFMSISRLTWLWPPSLHFHGFHLHIQISKFTQSLLPSSHHHNLQVFLPIGLITPSMWISKWPSLQPWSSLYCSILMPLECCIHMASKYITELSRFSPPRVFSRILVYYLLVASRYWQDKNLSGVSLS
jgi:hypothetical protein